MSIEIAEKRIAQDKKIGERVLDLLQLETDLIDGYDTVRLISIVDPERTSDVMVGTIGALVKRIVAEETE